MSGRVGELGGRGEGGRGGHPTRSSGRPSLREAAMAGRPIDSRAQRSIVGSTSAGMDLAMDRSCPKCVRCRTSTRFNCVEGLANTNADGVPASYKDDRKWIRRNLVVQLDRSGTYVEYLLHMVE